MKTIIFHPFASVPQWNTALASHEWDTGSFLLDAAEKAAPVVFAQLTLSPNLLVFQLRAASQEETGQEGSPFSHPSCLE